MLISACLLGVSCRYDGQSSTVATLEDLATHGRVVPFCPEVVGGLPTPRLPAEIEDACHSLDGHAVLDGQSRVVRRDGADLIRQFIAGAEAACDLAQRLGLRRAILTANSPSCGVGRIHSGQFEGSLVPGDGVTAARLMRAGLEVSTAETWLRGVA